MPKHSFTTPDILKKIKQIEIHTRRLLRGALVGDSRSALKGTGFEFDQIREYQFGDDVRFIDWNASARMSKLLVKQYVEERSRTILLAVDVSGSSFLGSGDTLKHDIMAQIASVLALVADSGKDRIGLLLFSDEIELYIPPARGRGHVHTIMEKVFGYQTKSSHTKITAALKKLAQLKRKDAIVFLISDFIDSTIDPAYLSFVAKQYDLIAVRCLDRREHELPAVGFLPVMDSETKELVTLDLRKKKQPRVRQFMQDRLAQQNKLLKRYGVNILDIANNDLFVGELIRFFRRRMRY